MERRIKGVLSPKASGSITITENGNYDVVDVANAIVNVVPEDVGADTSDATATENDILKGKTAYIASGKVEGAIETYDGAFEGYGGDGNVLKEIIDAKESCQYLFYNGLSIVSVDDWIKYSDTENATKFDNMFESCSRLTSIPLLNTSKGVSFKKMFQSCNKLETFPPLDTTNGRDLSYMFNTCSVIKNITLLSPSCTNFGYAFANCYELLTLDISYYNISSNSYSSWLVANCSSLKALIIREFGTKYVINSDAFNNSGIANGTGIILVPREWVDTLKSATNWSTYATQLRALEDYTIDGTTTGAIDESKLV